MSENDTAYPSLEKIEEAPADVIKSALDALRPQSSPYGMIGITMEASGYVDGLIREVQTRLNRPNGEPDELYIRLVNDTAMIALRVPLWGNAPALAEVFELTGKAGHR